MTRSTQTSFSWPLALNRLDSRRRDPKTARRTTVVLVVVAITVLIPVASFGQTATATLSGVVADDSDAVLPDATLRLLNVDTAVSRTTTANAGGSFTFPFVIPGRYTLRAERDGFAPAELANIVLSVGDHLSLRVRLKLGNVADAVSVVGEARPLTQSGTVATTIDRLFVENLPMNGRTFQSLIQLTPGAVPAAASTTLALGYSFIAFYESPLPGIGVSFGNLITD